MRFRDTPSVRPPDLAFPCSGEWRQKSHLWLWVLPCADVALIMFLILNAKGLCCLAKKNTIVQIHWLKKLRSLELKFHQEWPEEAPVVLHTAVSILALAQVNVLSGAVFFKRRNKKQPSCFAYYNNTLERRWLPSVNTPFALSMLEREKQFQPKILLQEQTSSSWP